jgi:hypothetical protein
MTLVRGDLRGLSTPAADAVWPAAPR